MAAAAAQGSYALRSSPYNRKNPRLNSAKPVRLSKPETNCSQDPETVIINVSGYRYETHLSTLRRFPDTLLGNSTRREEYYDAAKKEYFFDRNRKIFGAILEYYQSGGLLRRPDSVPLHRFVAEMLFYDLGDDVLKKYLELEEMLEDRPVMPKEGAQRSLWLALEVPASSRLAQILAVINVLVVFTAISNFCVQTLPRFQQKNQLDKSENSTSPFTFVHHDQEYLVFIANTATPFFYVETACTAYFCVELLCRFVASPVKKQFFCQFSNGVDLLSVIPYFVDLCAYAIRRSLRLYADAEKMDFFLIFRVFRLLQIFRILKLSRYSDGLTILWLTLKSARQELSVLFFMTAIGMTLSSAAVYFAELGYPDSDFLSIPHAFWWAVITWTNVGYGDMVPKHSIGRIVGGICSSSGVVCLAFIVPVVVAHFEYFFHRKSETMAERSLFNSTRDVFLAGGKEMAKVREVLLESGRHDLIDPVYSAFAKTKHSDEPRAEQAANRHRSGIDEDTGERVLETNL